MAKRHFKRIVLKLSGEALAGDQGFGINPDVVEKFAQEIAALAKSTDLEIAIVVGGGNLWRGLAGSNQGMDRATADYMGMLATMMNSLALQDALRQKGVEARVQSALRMDQVVEPYIRPRAIRAMSEGKVVIFAAGTGNPFFTTDTAACLRGIEIEANLILKATKVDGVYNKDPNHHDDAVKYDELTFDQVLDQKLGVMDLTAIALLREHNVPLQVFDMAKPNALLHVVMGEAEGTKVYQ